MHSCETVISVMSSFKIPDNTVCLAPHSFSPLEVRGTLLRVSIAHHN
jgi:hypothetical protein